MKNPPEALDRLLQAAARAPQGPPPPVPPALVARCVSAWRSAGELEETLLLIRWLRRSMAGAGALVLLSAAWYFGTPRPAANAEFYFEDSAVQIAFSQP